MSNLIIRNFKRGTKRSSLKLEEVIWQSFDDIAQNIRVYPAKLLSALAENYHTDITSSKKMTFTSFVRVFIFKANKEKNLKYLTDLGQNDLIRVIGSVMNS